ncbi:MAG: FAD-binding oxidoreductase [Pseudomonadota bacterium]
MTARILKADRLPFDPGPAGWDMILPAARRFPALEGSRTVDVAIVGAGFAGLSAARQLVLRDPSLHVAVVEARRIAEGPAGRNSGFMIDLPHHLASSDYAGAQEKDREKTRMNRRAIAFAGEAAAEYGLCAEAFGAVGKVNGAAGKRGVARNRTYAAHLRHLREPYELLDRRQMAELCGSDYYKSGLFTPGTAILQPALYVRGLAAGLEQDGVAILEDTPVQAMTAQSPGWLLDTPGGRISAARVILATNGHAESFGLFQKRLMHIYLYASMTRALSDDEVTSLGGAERWGITPSDPMGSTVRRISGTGGTRIVIRNGIRWAPGRSATEQTVASRARQHDRTFAARFPALHGVEMAYRWGGLLCLSGNGMPAFGECEPGLYAACCQNGLGTAFGTLSGRAAADLSLGIESEETRFMGGHEAPTRVPPEPLASIGAAVRLRWGEYAAGAEL